VTDRTNPAHRLPTLPLLEAIRTENLNVFRASPIRVGQDVAQKGEIAHDFQGRLVYQLLPNADDATVGPATLADRIVFTETTPICGSATVADP
jgi:hypothetical protein